MEQLEQKKIGHPQSWQALLRPWSRFVTLRTMGRCGIAMAHHDPSDSPVDCGCRAKGTQPGQDPFSGS